MNRAYAFLEDLQRQLADTNCTSSRSASIQEKEHLRSFLTIMGRSDAEIDSFLTDYYSNMPEPPSRFQDGSEYWLLIELAEAIERAAEITGTVLPPRPALGTLPTGQINALTIIVPDAERQLVVFDDQMPTFAMLLSKVIALALPFKQQKSGNYMLYTRPYKIFGNIARNPEIVSRFTNIVLSYAIDGQISNADPFLLPTKFQTIVSSSPTRSMELFVLGHEYGHLVMNHARSSLKRTRKLESMSFQEADYNWGQEGLADQFGLALSVTAMHLKESTNIPMSYWGADFFFSAVEIMDQALSLLRYGQDREPSASSSRSHPPISVRKELVREKLRKDVGEVLGKEAIYVGKALELTTYELWRRARKNVLRLHEEGVRPARRWNRSP
jgi:hypothetical protein